MTPPPDLTVKVNELGGWLEIRTLEVNLALARNLTPSFGNGEQRYVVPAGSRSGSTALTGKRQLWRFLRLERCLRMNLRGRSQLQPPMISLVCDRWVIILIVTT